MVIFPYRLRLKLREVKRDYPAVTLLEFAFNMVISAGVLVVATGGIYYLLTTIAPL